MMRILVAFLVLASLPAGMAMVSIHPSPRFDEVETDIAEAMGSYGVLGVSVAIIDDYEVVCARLWAGRTGSPGGD